MSSAPTSFTGPGFYDECLGPAQFHGFAADLARRLPQRPPGDVLEIACGTGIVTSRIRERLDPSVHLVATDLGKPMIDYAKTKLDPALDIEWLEADALKLPFPDGRFAAVVCGFGFMFVPDRQAALVEARRVLARDGLLLFNVWDAIEQNPHAAAYAAVVEAMFPGDAEMKFRLPYEMADHGLLRRLLAGANFGATRIETLQMPVHAEPRSIATGQVRGTPRFALLERRGVEPEVVIGKVAQALEQVGGKPYRGHAQAVVVEAVAI